MMLDRVSTEILASTVSFFVGLFVTTLCVPFVARKMREAGITGIDVHKPYKPTIPTMGGIGILIGLIAAVGVSRVILPECTTDFLAFISVVLIAGAVGVLDDLRPLDPRVKPLLTAIACLPIFLLNTNTYSPRPVLPIVGGTRLTVVYPLLIPFAVAVPANAVNMMDVLNGAMAGTCGIVSFVLLICAAMLGRWNVVALCAGLSGCLLAFYRYNRFPAKIFAGDTGGLMVGAAIGALAVIGRLEVVGLVALMPHITNAFYSLASIGRLYERREISARPIKVLDDGRLAASLDPMAPITLTRTVLAGGPLKEKDVINVFLLLTAFSGLLAFLTAILTVTA